MEKIIQTTVINVKKKELNKINYNDLEDWKKDPNHKYIGRKNSLKNHPRICDIDIIDFNKECLNISCSNNKVTIPHISLHKRNFVLIPLFEINRRWIHPKSKKNIVRLISSLSTNDLRSIKVI